MSEHYNILLTGAAGGIGRTIARHFAADGHKLLLTDINSEPLEKLATRLRSDQGAKVQTIAADLTNGESRNQLA